MRRSVALALVILLPLLAAAEDAAAEYQKRAKKLEQEEGTGAANLARHCESTKMWKEAVVELTRAAEVFPDSRDLQERLEKAQQRADTVVSRPTETEKAQYQAGQAALRSALAKKWKDLAAWAKGRGLEDESFEAAARAADFGETKAASSDPKQQAVDWLNLVRRKLKVGAVTLSPKLSADAQKHCDYLVLNKIPSSASGDQVHGEDPNLPGYTPEGARSGMSSDIGRMEPLGSMKGMIGTFYHRIPLLHPDLKEVGIGFAKSGDAGRWGGGWCAIDYSGVGDRQEKAPRVVAYPSPGQKGVPRGFDGENPDPRPAGTDVVGYPVTLTWFDGEEVRGVEMEVRAAGVLVPGYVSSQEKPARADFPNDNTACFMAEGPLAASTLHKVVVRATVKGEPFEMTWEFTTGTRMSEEGWR
ncbi:MAG: hypothetical protein HUU15_00465 [Candidatus Brocadiae bacterium]|nr:hypothetical protein [Candidatus Brocadiia bacterium]